MKIILGSDHAGLTMRRFLAARLVAAGHETSEVGAMDESSYDYPNAAYLVAEAILEKRAELGVLICGTGIGVSIAANRRHGIRAALCTTEMMARLAREHNHANVLCLGARVLGDEAAGSILEAFLTAAESDGPRHLHRIELLG